MEKWEQLHFKELEPFRCFWECLRCPFPNEDCLWDDPGIAEFGLVEYPEFFWWRFEQVFADSEEFLEITPDMMDGYFKEPEDPLQTRCPRCFSTKIDIGYPYIKCLNCGYNEPMIDFPVSYYYHLMMIGQPKTGCFQGILIRVLWAKGIDMKCSVQGCDDRVVESVGKDDEFHFCKDHGRAWGYYRMGFYRGRGFGCDGLLRRKVWNEAMQEFLRDCQVEIIALKQLGISKDASLVEAYKAATK